MKSIGKHWVRKVTRIDGVPVAQSLVTRAVYTDTDGKPHVRSKHVYTELLTGVAGEYVRNVDAKGTVPMSAGSLSRLHAALKRRGIDIDE